MYTEKKGQKRKKKLNCYSKSEIVEMVCRWSTTTSQKLENEIYLSKVFFCVWCRGERISATTDSKTSYWLGAK